MKLFNNKTLMLFAIILISGYGYVASCTHKDLIMPDQADGNITIQRGNDFFLPGTETIGDTSQWKMDKAHSSVLWSSNYLQTGALLTGRFNMFGLNSLPPSARQLYPVKSIAGFDTSWAFYENDPSKTYLSGYVQMNTSNTGEPGRDGNCYLGFVGAPKIISGTQNLTDSNVAVIRTTKVEFDTKSSGYIVTMVMSWQGLLAAPHDTTINGTLSYIKRATVGEGTAAPYDQFGLQLNFQFNCRSFGITTDEISDIVNVQCNMNFNNN